MFLMLFLFQSFSALAATQSQLNNATQIVNDLLNRSEVHLKVSYCTEGKLDCRTHYFLKDRSGRPLDAFYVTFVSADRQVGSTGYFIPTANKPGFYHRFEDMVFDAKKVITDIAPDIEIQKGHHPGHFRMLNFKIPRLGTTRYVQANLTAVTNKTILEGTELDTQDPNYSAPFKLIYNRISL